MKKPLTCKECGKDLGKVFAYARTADLRAHFREGHPELYAQYDQLRRQYCDYCREHGIPSGLMI